MFAQILLKINYLMNFLLLYDHNNLFENTKKAKRNLREIQDIFTLYSEYSEISLQNEWFTSEKLVINVLLAPGLLFHSGVM